MVRVALTTAAAGLALWLCACAGSMVGGEEGDGGSGSGGSMSPAKPAGSPAKQCESYASTWCNKSFGCYVKVGRLDAGAKDYNVDMCKKLIIDRLPCSAVQSVGSTYPTCLSHINAMACSQWDVPKEQFGNVPVPASCDEALAF